MSTTLDRLLDREELPPKLDKLRLTIQHRTGNAALMCVFFTGIYLLAGELLPDSGYRLLVLLAMAGVFAWLVSVVVNYQSRQSVRDYMDWLKGQPPVPSRVMRMGVPYERRPPTAAEACPQCAARPGQRHSRNCPSVPPEWFEPSSR